MTVEKIEAKKDSDEKETSAFLQIREILESLAVALFLAFLFKTFEAEAFVIPTGSMAPTLKGRHKDVVCDECRYPFQTSASEEIDSANNRRTGLRVVAGVCPQCGFTQYFGDEKPSLKNDKLAPSYTGDRILVSKMTFDQRELARWDVSVFRSPGDPKINFIKRIVGLPNENLRVQYGDLFVQKIEPVISSEDVNSYTEPGTSSQWSPDVNLDQAEGLNERSRSNLTVVESSEPFTIARKDYKYLRQILQVVHDNDYVADKLRKVGWPDRWTDELTTRVEGQCAWSAFETKKSRGFYFKGEPVDNLTETTRIFELGTKADVSPVSAEDRSFYWLRYRHIVPSSNDWQYLTQGQIPPKVLSTGIIENNPRLIDDFSAYNAGISRRQTMRDSVDRSGVRVSKLVNEWERSNYDEFSHLSQKIIDSDGNSRVYCTKSPDGLGCNWVGDLAVSCNLTIENAVTESDQIAFDLVKGGVVFRCLITPSIGSIIVSIPSVQEFEPQKASFNFANNKSYRFVFLNVDEEMRVVIDDQELQFGDLGGGYDFLTCSSKDIFAPLPRNRDPNARDLSPVAIGAKGVAVRVEKLKILRDVYYIAAGRMLEEWDATNYNDFNTARCDRLSRGASVYLDDENEVARFMSSPDQWLGYGNTKSALLTQHEGQYVAFGDNSGFSLDSRLWADVSVPHYVDRKYLIGKAFYVYWPHGWPLPIIKSPFWPNFAKMRHID